MELELLLFSFNMSKKNNLSDFLEPWKDYKLIWCLDVEREITLQYRVEERYKRTGHIALISIKCKTPCEIKSCKYALGKIKKERM